MVAGGWVGHGGGLDVYESLSFGKRGVGSMSALVNRSVGDDPRLPFSARCGMRNSAPITRSATGCRYRYGSPSRYLRSILSFAPVVSST